MADNSELMPTPEVGDPNHAGMGLAQPGIDYRQLSQPAQVLEARWMPSSGRASAAEELSGAFKEFSSTAAGEARKLNTVAGSQAGASDALQPGFVPRSGLAAVTAYGSAYNAAAHLTYVNSTNASVSQQMDKAEIDFAGDPVGFAKQAAIIHDATLAQTPKIYAPEVSNSIQQRMTAGMTRTQAQAVQTARSDAWESYTSTVDSRQRDALKTAIDLPEDQQAALIQKTIADNRTQLDALVAARAITPEKSAILQNHFVNTFQDQIHGQHTARIVDGFMVLARGNVDDGDKALAAYVKDPNNSLADKVSVTHDYETQREGYTKSQSQLHADDLASVGQQLVQGKYGNDIEPQIHQLYKQGAINPEGLHSLMDKSMENQVKGITDDSSNLLFDAAMHGTGPKLDPKDPQVVKDSDAYFKAHVMLNGVTPGTDAYAIGASNFVKQTNIVPPMVRSQIRIGLMNGDPQSAVAAATLADRIQKSNPQADLYAQDPKLESLSSLISDNVRAGLNPVQAYQMAVQQTTVNSGEAKVRNEAYAAAIKNQNQGNPDAANTVALQKQLNTNLSPGIFSGNAPNAPVPMQAENDSLVRQYFAATGDLPKAQELAGKQILKTWGLSTVNGAKEIVKYPIPDRDVPLVRADIAKTAQSLGYTGDPNDLKLTPSPLTDQSQGRFWTLTHTDAQGVTDTLLDSKNQPIQFDVRQTSQAYAKQKQDLINQKLDAARKDRDFQRSQAAEQIQGEQQLSNMYLNPGTSLQGIK